MSSLAATQADGMYIPPEYIESGAYKKKSISQFAGSKGHNQFLTRSVCRFELPFDGFCTACDAIVGKGTRFNAHKAHVDDYFTTKIYEFTTKCRACGECEFKIRTNPKERSFDYTDGIRKKVEEFDSAEAGTHGVIDTDFGNGILEYKNGSVVDAPTSLLDDNNNVHTNIPGAGGASSSASASALHLLEKNVSGFRKAQTEHEQMTSLLELNSKTLGEGYAESNASLRASFRKDRKAKKRRLGEAAGMGLGKGIELLPEDSVATEEDATLAKYAMKSRRGKPERDKLRSVRAGSIFASAASPKKKLSSKHRKGASRKHNGQPNNHGDKQYERQRRIGESNKKVSAPKQKITVKLVGGGHTVVAQNDNTTRALSTDQSGALAALSSCYASDSD